MSIFLAEPEPEPGSSQGQSQTLAFLTGDELKNMLLQGLVSYSYDFLFKDLGVRAPGF